MANTFKNSKLIDVGTGATTLYTVPGSTTTVVIGLNIANKNASSRTITASWTDATDSDNSTCLLNEVAIPGDTSLEVFAGQKIVLMTGDVLKILASATSSIDATVSYMEITA